MQDHDRKAALERLMDAHAAEVYRCCLGMLHDRHAAEDASQEAFLRAFRRLEGYRRESSERTWLLAIAINVCRDMLRRPERRRVLSVADVAAAAPAPEPGAYTPLYEAVQALPQQQRAAVLLHYFHDLTCEETARALRISRGTVFSHLRRARQALGAALGPERRQDV